MAITTDKQAIYRLGGLNQEQMDMDDYQRTAQSTDQRPGSTSEAFIVPLLGLAGETGALLTEYKKLIRDGSEYSRFTTQLKEELGDVLWYTANLATKFGLSLQEIAEANLAKTQDRWKEQEPARRRAFFDDDFPSREQLPRSFAVRFEHQMLDGRRKLVVTRDGIQVGDPLTDNAHEDDGYRYHDAYHYTFASVLAWSPVTRRNLQCKRRSRPDIDEVEDGGRGRVVEEGVAALAYTYASQHEFFATSQRIDGDLLKTIKLLTHKTEVRERSANDWENAIIMGSRMFALLRENEGGVLDCSLIQRQIRYAAP